MVVFTCNACGESVKKGQVEKHVNMCRNCQCLSCMDCGKDFWGDDYKCHVKCLSEDQKYGGKGYEAKTHKGDVKQQEWIQKIHETIKETNNPKVQDILEQICAYDNIPRKKRKFQNWIANSLKIHSTALQDQVWDIFSEATSKETVKKESVKNEPVPPQSEDNVVKTEKPAKKKSTREQKPKKMRLQDQQESLEITKSKKSKREAPGNAKMSRSNHLKMAPQQAVDSAEFEMNGNCLDVEPVSKANVQKRKRSLSNGDCPIVQKRLNNSETEENEDEHQGKFSWKGTIKAVLKQAPDNEISVKKLRKKVLAQYYAIAGDHHKSEEEILALFNKKVNSNPKFRVLKEKVKLLK
ncbi:cell growth-regulating nucleolar protein [Elgaria multicarinata webbii]|uniref:cell growth-regulating nucleolar protein n=1 Tax=Elgaria multicarinata webbii TaxID=159646 RepID=UPI002FCCD46C